MLTACNTFQNYLSSIEHNQYLMTSKTPGYILIGLGGVTYLFFKNYQGGVIPYPSLFYALGIATFAGGFGLLFLASKNHIKKINRYSHNEIDDLKHNGERIPVNFSQCEIKENNYSEEVEKNYSDSKSLGLLTGHTNNIEIVSRNQSVIVYEASNGSRIDKFVSPVIPKDKATLMFLLDAQKQTTLYVDKTNSSRYFFDLDFLS